VFGLFAFVEMAPILITVISGEDAVNVLLIKIFEAFNVRAPHIANRYVSGIMVPFGRAEDDPLHPPRPPGATDGRGQGAGSANAGSGNVVKVYGFFAKESGGKADPRQQVLLAALAVAFIIIMRLMGASWNNTMGATQVFLGIGTLLIGYQKPAKEGSSGKSGGFKSRLGEFFKLQITAAAVWAVGSWVAHNRETLVRLVHRLTSALH
jgi:hypothetical protein